MPCYEFRCKPCGTTFELRRPMSDSDAPATCPEGHPAVRLLSVFASVGGRESSSGSGGDVAATMSASKGGGCGPGCGCH